ncbi:MAG: 2-hydroxyacid dehydrogenase [Rhodospirillales bacterium]
MTKTRVFVMSTLPEPVEARLARDYDPVFNADDRKIDPASLGRAAGRAADGCEAVICSPVDQFNADAISALPASVRMLPTFSVGFNHIDLAAAAARGLIVTNTPDVLTGATADIAMLCLLGAARRAHEAQSLLRSGAWTGWRPTQLMGAGLTGKRLGVFGVGRIGGATAHRARAFGMQIHYYNTSPRPDEDALGAQAHESPESLLRVSDMLSIHCPLTPETNKFLNAERIAMLPEGAVVVNTARGPIVDDAALIAALKSGRVAAAGLDVFDGEPDIHPGYLDCPNAFLLPHIGSGAAETRTAMGFRVLDNMDAFFAGRTPPHRVA